MRFCCFIEPKQTEKTQFKQSAATVRTAAPGTDIPIDQASGIAAVPTLSRIALTIPPADVDRSHVTDLAVQDVAGSNVLFATTRLDGVVTSWNSGGGGLASDRCGRLQKPSFSRRYARTGICGGHPADGRRYRRIDGIASAIGRGVYRHPHRTGV